MLFLISCTAGHTNDTRNIKREEARNAIAEVSNSALPVKEKVNNYINTIPNNILVSFYNIHKDNVSQYVSFGFPMPPSYKGKFDTISVLDKDGKEIPSHISHAVPLYNFISKKPRLGALKITIDRNNVVTEQNVYVSLNTKHSRFINLPDNYNVRNEWSYFSDKNYPENNSMKEPSVYAALPSSWLLKCKLLGDSVGVMEYSKMGWFDRAYLNFSHTAVNNVSSYVKAKNLISLTNKAEPWLFDRTKTLFGIYIRTGDVFWLKHAHRSAEYYRYSLNPEGYLGLKRVNDIKYSYPLSLALDLLLTADISLINDIRKSADSTIKWNPEYIPTRRFWTERHQSYALLASMVAYEFTGEVKYKKKTRDIIESSYKLFKPNNAGWESSDCMLHSMGAHEGGADLRPICSPWMSALFSETLMRYYNISNDKRSLEMLEMLTDFIIKYALYSEPKNPKFDNMLVPWYLASRSVKFSDSGIYADLEHSCDVAGMLARGIVIKKKLSRPIEVAKSKLNKLLNACSYNLNSWYRNNSDFNYGKPVWRLSPARRYSWVFGSTFDLVWLIKVIDDD